MFISRKAILATLLTGTLPGSVPAYDVQVTPLDFVSINYSVSQIEYSSQYNLLFLCEGEIAVRIIDLTTKVEINRHLPTEKFTDMDLTADEKYLFLADYGGTYIGYGNPIDPHYVHRYDLVSRTWKIAQAPAIAWKIEAISAEKVLLQEQDQHVEMTLNSFGNFMSELSRISADYYGDFEYDPVTQRVYHGSSGSSSSEIHVRRVIGNTLIDAGNTGTYGTADTGGGTSVLSTDGRYFYYGALQVEADSVTNNIRTFPEMIRAASKDIAFGNSKYFSADLGVELGTLGFSSTVYGVSENGTRLAALDAAGLKVRLYSIGVPTAPKVIALLIEGPAGIGFYQSTPYHAYAIYNDGARVDVTTSSSWSMGSNLFGSIDSAGVLTADARPGEFTVHASFTEGLNTVLATKKVTAIPGYGESGVVDMASFSLQKDVLQMEYAASHGLLFLRAGESRVLVVDADTRAILQTHYSTEKFTDMDLTSDENFLFVADYGGYPNPAHPHYVHRFDLNNQVWKIAQAPQVAWKIEAVSSDRVLLQEYDQWIDITLNSFGDSMAELSRVFTDYFGDMEYDAATQRIYHGNSGSSSHEINVLKIQGNILVSLGGTGTYGSADAGGGTSVLTPNGQYFFFGGLQVEAANITHNIRMLPMVYAASNAIAFAENRYYDAETGIGLSGLGFNTKIYTVSEDGNHLWAFQSEGDMLHHYDLAAPAANNLPVACIVGEGDLVVHANTILGAEVHLDGSCSTDSDSTQGTNSDIIVFNWYKQLAPLQGQFLANGESVHVTLLPGIHEIVLIVTDTNEDQDSVSTFVNVPERGDVDGDGQVELSEAAAFMSCMSGPMQVEDDPVCLPFDFDFNQKIDLADAAGMQNAFGSP